MTNSSPRGKYIPHRRTRTARPSLTLLLALLCVSTFACAQSTPTASRVGDLQIGGGFIYAHSAYNFTPITLYGGAGYIDFAKRPHWGGEFDFHQTKSSADTTVYERTYEIGPRIFIQRGRLIPYAKVMYGRGVYNFHNNIANVAYNMYTFGGGFDYELFRSINLRADYEYQTWMSFPISDLHPSVVTIGVAYHFHQ